VFCVLFPTFCGQIMLVTFWLLVLLWLSFWPVECQVGGHGASIEISQACRFWDMRRQGSPWDVDGGDNLAAQAARRWRF
jgi:hypothetical protein